MFDILPHQDEMIVLRQTLQNVADTLIEFVVVILFLQRKADEGRPVVELKEVSGPSVHFLEIHINASPVPKYNPAALRNPELYPNGNI